MKINIKTKDFLNKESLQSSLDTLIKKPLNALISGKVPSLPYCYEMDYFGPDAGFLCIGETKEVQALFKKQRVKGQGKDQEGNMVKVDKRKVAYGTVQINEQGVYEFIVEGGMMKRNQAKAVIKSIPLLKKNIGENFAILDKAPETTSKEETTTNTLQEEQPNPEQQKRKALRKAKREKIKENVGKLEQATGTANPDKIRENLDKYKQVLEQLIEEANADGVVDQQEQDEIDALHNNIENLEQQIGKLEQPKLTPQRRAKVQENVQKIDQRLQEMAEKLGITL